jgi:hypothetical protein
VAGAFVAGQLARLEERHDYAGAMAGNDGVIGWRPFVRCFRRRADGGGIVIDAPKRSCSRSPAAAAGRERGRTPMGVARRYTGAWRAGIGKGS